MRTIVYAAVIAAISALPAAAQGYVYRGPNGVPYYTNQPPTSLQQPQPPTFDPNGAAARRDAMASKARSEAQISSNFSEAAKQGYQTITFEDFGVDSADLTAHDAAIVITGQYQKVGNIDYLYLDLNAAMLSGGSTRNAIPLMIDGATREIRKRIYECNSWQFSNPKQCSITVMGNARSCSVSNAIGGTREVACIAVSGGWWTTYGTAG